MNAVTQEELDWLAEGGLESSERQQLFDRLDEQDDGWKRCALALLEQKALATLLSNGPNGKNSSVTPKVSPLEDAGRNRSSHWKRWSQFVLVAGIAGICFTAGFLFPSPNAPGISREMQEPETVDDPNQQLRDRLANGDPNTVLAVSRAVQQINVADRELVALVAIQHNQQELLLPIIESDLLSQRFVEMPAPAMPDSWSTQFTKSGWDLKPHREFLSLHLPDGTNEVLPVNLMNCRYVGKPIL